MSPRLLSFIRASCILLVLVLFAQLLPTAAAFTNGQAASLVLGQPNFTSNAYTTIASGMNYPTGVAVDPTSGKVFVADHYNHRVLRFASSVALLSGIAAEGVLGHSDFTSYSILIPPTASGMSAPIGVAVDNTGRLWVADSNNERVLRFDRAASKPNGAPADGVLGQPDFTSYAFATTASALNNPTSVAVDSAGRLWVADQNNNRVLRFDDAANKANGANADGVFGQPGFTSSAFATTANSMREPFGVAVDSAGTLWVTDTLNNRVLRFDDAAGKTNGIAANGVLGQPDFTSYEQPVTASGMNSPNGVAVDGFGRLWVADYYNSRVLRFDGAAGKPNGMAADGVLGQIDFSSRAQVTTASGMNLPAGVAVDSTGTLWVADYNNNRVLRFDDLIIPTIRRTSLPLIIR